MGEIKINSFDNVPIHCHIWDNVKNPRATLQVSHGMCEHGGRYEEFARKLNAAGYIVFADDHRAHGKTETEENRGRHSGDIYQKTLADLVFFHNWLKNEYNLPQVFLGHSYGSFLAQGFLQSETDIKGVACCGTADMNGAQAALALIWPVQLLAKNWRPAFVNKAGDFIFDIQYKNDRGPSQWVTSDLERRREFLEDPMAGIDVSINFDWCMIKAFGRLYKKENLEKLNPETPIGIFSGKMDPIGGKNSSRAIKLAKRYKSSGVKTVKTHLYENARHELHNEHCREEFYDDLIKFFNECID